MKQTKKNSKSNIVYKSTTEFNPLSGVCSETQEIFKNYFPVGNTIKVKLVDGDYYL